MSAPALSCSSGLDRAASRADASVNGLPATSAQQHAPAGSDAAAGDAAAIERNNSTRGEKMRAARERRMTCGDWVAPSESVRVRRGRQGCLGDMAGRDTAARYVE